VFLVVANRKTKEKYKESEGVGYDNTGYETLAQLVGIGKGQTDGDREACLD
jgi:hypothetical protein